jgi:peptide/nickel transport system permease protein
MKALTVIVQRLLLLAVVLLIVSFITFGIVNILPGDVANAILGDLGTPDQVEALRERLGLNLPLLVRYEAWIVDFFRGDFGTSLQTGQQISPIMFARFGNSAILGGLTLLIAVPLSVLLGVIAAVHRGKAVDRIISGFSIVSFSLPEYVIGLLLILVFSIWFPILPGASLIEPNASPLTRPEALVLPVTVLVLGMLAYLSQFTRAGMIEALQAPYVRTAILKGLPRWTVVLKHALPNVLLPTICEVGMIFGYVLGGIVIVETLFSYAGIGQMTVDAIAFRDIPVVQASVLIIAVAYGVGNLLADVVSILLNPRLRT